MMRRNWLIVGTILATIVIAIFIVSKLTTIDVPPSAPTIALQTLVTIPGTCDTFNADWSLVSASGIIYDATTGKSLLTTKSAGTGVPAYRLAMVQFSPNSAYVAVPGEGVYDLHSGQLLFGLTSIDRPHFSPDSSYIGFVADGVYELPSGKQILSLNKSFTEGIAFSPDSRHLANINDGVYDLASGKRMFAIGGRTSTYVTDTEEADFSPDGKFLSVGYDDTYQMDTGEKTSERVEVIAFSADSSVAITFRGIYELPSLKRIYPVNLGGAQTAISTFNGDEKRVLVQSSETLLAKYPSQISVYDIPTRRPLLTVNGVDGYESESALSPDGKLLANWKDGVYDVDSGKKLFPLEGNGHLLFSKDSSLVFATIDTNKAGAYDARTGKLRYTIKPLFSIPYPYVHSMTQGIFTSAGGQIITDGSAVYEAATGAHLGDGSVVFQPNGNKIALNPVKERTHPEGTVTGDCKIDTVTPLSPPTS